MNGDVDQLLGTLINLHHQGIEYVKVCFSGGGDNGDIDTVEYLLPEFIIDDGDMIELNESYHKDGTENNWGVVLGNKQDDNITDIIKDNVDTVCQSIGDWWNNEGGYGTLYLRTKDASYHLTTDFYVQKTENENTNGKITA